MNNVKLVLVICMSLWGAFAMANIDSVDHRQIIASIMAEGTESEQQSLLQKIETYSDVSKMQLLETRANVAEQQATKFLQDHAVLEQALTIFRTNLVKHIQEESSFEKKQDGSLVSAIEKEIEQKIGKYLAQVTPWASFEGEEGYKYTADNKHGYQWYLDPIDGTISFKNNLDTFGMTLTLVKDNVPVATIIDFPRLLKTYIAYRNQGAYRNGKPISMHNQCAEGSHLVVAHSDRYAFALANRKNVLNSIEDLPYVTRTYTDIYAYSLVAEGKCSAKIDIAGALWDLFPGFLLITEAGGSVKFYPADNPNSDLFGSMIVGQKKTVENIHSILYQKDAFNGRIHFDDRIPTLNEVGVL